MTIRPNKLFLCVLSALFLLFSGTGAGTLNAADIKLRTVVIDAGHGGHDPGALSPDRKLRESDINLAVALELGGKIKERFPDMKVIYTRSKDVFIPLADRASIANRNHADLFISIHVNAAGRKSTAGGTETYVMGTDKSESNMEVCRKENSVILLEDNYTATYQGFDPDNVESYIFFNLMQNAHFEQSIAMASMVQQELKKGPVPKSRGVKQAPLMVLWRTTMPSILVEIGFITNAADRKAISTSQGKKATANALFNAFCTYKQQYDSNAGFTFEFQDSDDNDDIDDMDPAVPAVDTSAAAAPEPAAEPEPSAVSSVPEKYYRIQIFASGKKIKEGSPEFKGITGCECTKVNGLYKYTVGRYSTKEEAQAGLASVRKKFNGAFVTCF